MPDVNSQDELDSLLLDIPRGASVQYRLDASRYFFTRTWEVNNNFESATTPGLIYGAIEYLIQESATMESPGTLEEDMLNGTAVSLSSLTKINHMTMAEFLDSQGYTIVNRNVDTFVVGDLVRVKRKAGQYDVGEEVYVNNMQERDGRNSWRCGLFGERRRIEISHSVNYHSGVFISSEHLEMV
jgi:hypothetical protein